MAEEELADLKQRQQDTIREARSRCIPDLVIAIVDLYYLYLSGSALCIYVKICQVKRR